MKNILIISGSSKIGNFLVKEYLKENDVKILATFYKNKNVREIYKNYIECKKLFFIKFDIFSENYKEFIKKIKDNLGYVDIVIFTIGNILKHSNILNVSFEEINYLFYSNFFYIYKMLNEIINNNLLNSNNGGSIIVFGYSNIDKSKINEEIFFYHLAKYNLLLFIKKIASRLYMEFNYNINMISPGILEDAPYIPNSFKDNFKLFKNSIIFNYEIKKIIDFLYKNRKINGNNILISGGYNIE